MKRMRNFFIGVGVAAVFALGAAYLVVYDARHSTSALNTDAKSVERAELSEKDAESIRIQAANAQRKAFGDALPVTDEIVNVSLTAHKERFDIGGVNVDGLSYAGGAPDTVIRVPLGAKLRVTFTNGLDKPTTLHWHGVRVPNGMDGVPGVTQDPIEPGGSFVYEFTPKDAGTFWFHSHVNASEQIEKGLYGALIVEDPADPKFDEDVVWMLDDWLMIDGGLYPEFNTRHDLAHDGRWGNVFTVNGVANPTFMWKAGETVRLRLINVANGRVFKPAIGALNPDVVAFDGVKTPKGMRLSDIELAPGNRVDLLVRVPTGRAGATLGVQDLFTGRPNQLATIDVAPPTEDRNDVAWAYPAPIDWNRVAEIPIDERIVLDARSGGKYGITWTLNGLAYGESPGIDRSGADFVVMELENPSPRLHPMHLHGQFFRVIARNGQPVDEPYWRDTVLVRPRESVRIAFAPLERGTWALHCHILEHAESGMMTTITF